MDELAILGEPTHVSPAISDYNTPVVEDLHMCGLKIKVESVYNSSFSDFVLFNQVVLAKGKIGVAFRMEEDLGNDAFMNVSFLDKFLGVWIPEHDRIVDVDGTADHQTLVGMPVDRVDTIYVVVKGLLDRENLVLLLLLDVNHNTLFVSQPTGDFGF